MEHCTSIRQPLESTPALRALPAQRVVFVGPGIAEVHEHSVTHVLRYEATITADSLSDALLIGCNAATSTERVLQAQAKLRHELLARPDPAFWGEVALSYLPWAPTVDRQLIPESPIDRRGDRLAGRIKQRGNAAVPFVRRLDRSRITEDALSAIAAPTACPQSA